MTICTTRTGCTNTATQEIAGRATCDDCVPIASLSYEENRARIALVGLGHESALRVFRLAFPREAA